MLTEGAWGGSAGLEGSRGLKEQGFAAGPSVSILGSFKGLTV